MVGTLETAERGSYEGVTPNCLPSKKATKLSLLKKGPKIKSTQKRLQNKGYINKKVNIYFYQKQAYITLLRLIFWKTYFISLLFSFPILFEHTVEYHPYLVVAVVNVVEVVRSVEHVWKKSL
jgi:peptidoglycan hydrolase-like protein with peptidoglycan-binding domain